MYLINIRLPELALIVVCKIIVASKIIVVTGKSIVARYNNL